MLEWSDDGGDLGLREKRLWYEETILKPLMESLEPAKFVVPISLEENRIDLTRSDEYLGHIVPGADVETCLRVLRTIRNVCLGPNFVDANGAVILSHAHAKIAELVKMAE